MICTYPLAEYDGESVSDVLIIPARFGDSPVIAV